MREKGGGKPYAPAMAGSAGSIFRWDAAAATHRGRVRRRNEDSFLTRPERRLYAVADGMGGHAAGNVASALAVATLDAAIPRAPSPRIGAATMSKRLRAAVDAANAAVLQRAAARPSEAGMGTTLTVLSPLVALNACVIAHVGDSRAYRYRAQAAGLATAAAQRLTQLTRDHTWVQQQVDAGALTAAQARVHPKSNMLTRVIGMDDVGRADVVVSDVLAGDVFLLCTDGLTGMLTDPEIEAILARATELQSTCDELVDAANAAGGRDNVTVVLIRAFL